MSSKTKKDGFVSKYIKWCSGDSDKNDLIEANSKELEALKSQLASLQDELAGKESAIKEKDTLNGNLREHNADLQRENGRIQSRLVNMKNERNNLQRRIENLERQRSKFQSEADRLRNRNRFGQGRLVYQSNSSLNVYVDNGRNNWGRPNKSLGHRRNWN